MKNKKQHLLQAVFLVGGILGSAAAFADRDHNDNVANYMDTCENLPLVNTLIGGPVNTSVCVDAPVALEKAKVVFNLDMLVSDGSGNPVGLRHMWMLGKALQARINMGLLDPEDVSVMRTRR